MNREEIAKQYFLNGYSCSQSVVLSFKDLVGINEKDLVKISSPFGGGMGRMRETCGALTGAFIILGYLYGNDDNDAKKKMDLYVRVQEIAKKFIEINGFMACRKLLHLDHDIDSPKPEERNAEYYHKRQCPEIVGSAARILDEYIKIHPIK